jgi:hypothetical protein
MQRNRNHIISEWHTEQHLFCKNPAVFFITL